MTNLRIAMLMAALSPISIVHADDRSDLLVAPCTSCHTEQSVMPSIFGRPADELTATLQDLKSGHQASTIMGRLLRGYSDEEITELGRVLAGTKGQRNVD